MTSTAENSNLPTSTDDLAVPENSQDGETSAAPAAIDPHVHTAVEAALGRKAEGLLVLEVAKVSDFTDHFMICSGSNERQVQAIADAVLKDLRQQGMRPLHVEGLNQGRWILLDFGGDMVIHIFLEETRRFYDLERLWSDAPVVTDRYAEAPPEPESTSEV